MKINTTSINQELINNCKIEAAAENAFFELDNKVIGTIELNERLIKSDNVVKSASAANGAVTLYTTPTNKDFYLTSATLNFTKDVTATAAYADLRITLADGDANQVLTLAHITLTAGSMHQGLTFRNGILLKRGTTITCTADAYGANIRLGGSITGYLIG